MHRQAERLVAEGLHILFIGHRGHPEVIGTFGQVPDGRMTLIETAADAEAIAPADPANLAFLTQTTLSVDDTAEMIAILQRRFPAIRAPRGEDICYATSNRQAAVKAIAAQCDAMLVIGAPNSSNSLRLVEVAERSGVKARLIERAADVDFAWLDGVAYARHHRRRLGPRDTGARTRRPARDALRRDRAARPRRCARTWSSSCPAASTPPPEPTRMAVYTQVSAEELEALLARYDVGRLDSAKGIAEGVENSNFLVDTDRAAASS